MDTTKPDSLTERASEDPHPPPAMREHPAPAAHPHRQGKLHVGRLGRAILLRFGIMSGLSLVLLLAAFFYTGWRQMQEIRRSQKHTATWVANSLDDWIAELENGLATMAQYPGFMDLPAAAMGDQIRQVRMRNAALVDIAVIDARPEQRGAELVRVGERTTFSGANHAEAGWFQDVMARQSSVHAVGYDATGVAVLDLVWTVEESGQVVGLIQAQAQLSAAYRLLRQVHIAGEEGYLYVIDAQGRPIVHEHTPFVFAHRAFTDVQGIQAAITGLAAPLVYAGLNSEQEAVTGTYQELRGGLGAVVAEEPLRRILRGLLPLFLAAAGVITVTVAAAVVVGSVISRQAIGPILRLREGAERVGSGDLGYILVPEGQTELADVASEFNRMTERVRESHSHLEERVAQRTAALQLALQRLREAGDTREGLLAVIRDMSGRLASTAAELAATATQQAASTTEQSTAIAQVVATVDQVRTTSARAAGRAQTVANLARHTVEVGQSGLQAATDSAAGIRQVQEQAEALSVSIAVLAEETETIAQIIASVAQLASQSRLLALNAAVESARAGEAGRGFAVVAGEVRSLADRSRTAADQIRDILGGISRRVVAAAVASEEERLGSQASSRLAAQAGQAIDDLAAAARESAAEAAAIAAAAREQLLGMDQVGQAMEGIQQATVQNASAAHQVERAAAELSELAGRLDEQIRVVQGLAAQG